MYKYYNVFLRNKILITAILIFILASFLRFYHVPQLFVFTADEEYAITLAQTIVKDFHIIWIGENAADTGFYMGPFWVYFTAFWLYLSKGNPLILAYVVAGIGSITAVIIFFVAKSLFNYQIALITSLLFSLLPLRVYYDKKFWLLNPAPFITVSLFYSLCQTYKNKLWWLVVAILFGLILHIHLSLLPFGIVILYVIWSQRKKINKRILILSFIAFLLTISPLIAFDYFHKGSNITTPLRLINDTSSEKRSIDFNDHFQQLYQSFGRLWYLYPNRSNSDEVLFACHPFNFNKSILISNLNTTASKAYFIPSFLSLLLFMWFMWFFIRSKTWKNNNYKIFALSLIVLLLGFIFFPGLVMEYYLFGVVTLFLFIPGILFSNLNGFPKYAFLVFLIVIFSLGISTVLSATSEYGFLIKIKLVQKVSLYLGSNTFELRETGLCHSYEGWRTMFITYGEKPERSSADASLGYLYPDEISNKMTQYIVVMSEKRIPFKYDPEITKVFTEGGFQALVIKK